MKLEILIKSHAKKTEILSLDPFVLAVAAPPEKNKANREIIRFLSHYFKKQVRIVSGFTSKRKIIELF